mmetsp:Transcript_18395/g.71075  ORF Transcript_18395/g.71075 Transcript_18395/m.71075 type:complete len:335 (+) Transcript_18395:899-1903(+)
MGARGGRPAPLRAGRVRPARGGLLLRPAAAGHGRLGPAPPRHCPGALLHCGRGGCEQAAAGDCWRSACGCGEGVLRRRLLVGGEQAAQAVRRLLLQGAALPRQRALCARYEPARRHCSAACHASCRLHRGTRRRRTPLRRASRRRPPPLGVSRRQRSHPCAGPEAIFVTEGRRQRHSHACACHSHGGVAAAHHDGECGGIVAQGKGAGHAVPLPDRAAVWQERDGARRAVCIAQHSLPTPADGHSPRRLLQGLKQPSLQSLGSRHSAGEPNAQPLLLSGGQGGQVQARVRHAALLEPGTRGLRPRHCGSGGQPLHAQACCHRPGRRRRRTGGGA